MRDARVCSTFLRALRQRVFLVSLSIGWPEKSYIVGKRHCDHNERLFYRRNRCLNYPIAGYFSRKLRIPDLFITYTELNEV